MTRKYLIDRIDTLTPEELSEAWRATARGDETHRAGLVAEMDDDRAEVLEFFLANWDALDDAAKKIGIGFYVSDLFQDNTSSSATSAPEGTGAPRPASLIYLCFVGRSRSIGRPAANPALQIPLRQDRAAAAGPRRPFPQDQALPSAWFGGRSVVLHFHRSPSGVWYIHRTARTGILGDLILEFWTTQNQALCPSIRVTGRAKRLPSTDWSMLHRISVALAEL